MLLFFPDLDLGNSLKLKTFGFYDITRVGNPVIIGRRL